MTARIKDLAIDLTLRGYTAREVSDAVAFMASAATIDFRGLDWKRKDAAIKEVILAEKAALAAPIECDNDFVSLLIRGLIRAGYSHAEPKAVWGSIKRIRPSEPAFIKDGAEFPSYGKTLQRWRLHPTTEWSV
jgi:hypothetical protein